VVAYMIYVKMGINLLVILSSSVKMVNQLLAGVHIASAAEAMAFAARLNLRTRRVFEIMQHSRGYSWYICLIMPFLMLIAAIS
jgi:3-hydroxyisobutyrate dehydrogenase-like beta-hydroxyacid dehydrogenase